MHRRFIPRFESSSIHARTQNLACAVLFVGLIPVTTPAQWVGPVTDIDSEMNQLLSVASNGAFALEDSAWHLVHQPTFRPIAMDLAPPRLALVGGTPGEMGAIAAFDRETSESTETIVAEDCLYDVALLPERQLAFVAAHDGSILSIEWPSLERSSVSRVFQHNASARGVAISPDSQWLASCALDGLVALKPLGPETSAPIIIQDHTAGVEAIAFSQDGQTLASSSIDGKIRLHNLEGRLIRTYSGFLTERPGSPWKAPPPIQDLSWTNDALLAAAKEGALYLLDPDSDSWETCAQALHAPLYCIRAQTPGTLWIGSQSGVHRLQFKSTSTSNERREPPSPLKINEPTPKNAL